MKPANENKTYRVIENPLVAKILTDPHEAQVVQWFMGQELSIKDAAKRLGWPTLRVYRRVRRLVELEVLQVTRTEPARGSATRFYTATATAFFIPFRLTPYENYQAFLLHSDDLWRRRFYKGLSAVAKEASFGELGKYIYLDSDGRVREIVGSLGSILPPEYAAPSKTPSPAIWNDWSWVCLEAGAARALRLEMVELFKRYVAQHKPGEQNYIVRMGMSPIVE